MLEKNTTKYQFKVDSDTFNIISEIKEDRKVPKIIPMIYAI